MASAAYAQTDPCATALGNRSNRILGLSLADINLLHLRPASPCTVVAEGKYGKRKLLAFGDIQGAVSDTLTLAGDSAEYQLLPWGEGVLRIRLGALENGIQGTYYTPPSAQGIPWRTDPLKLMLQALLPKMLPPPTRQLSIKEAEAYQQNTFELLAVGAYAQRLALLVRQTIWECVPTRHSCCTPPRYSYTFLQLGADGLTMPTGQNGVLVDIPAEYCPIPKAPCSRTPGPFSDEALAGVLHTQQPVAYIGAGRWICNTGRSLVQVNVAKKSVSQVPLPPKWRASQVFVEGITSDEARQTPMLFIRVGGLVRQAESNRAFAMNERFVVGTIKTVPLPELSKGPKSSSVEDLELLAADRLLTSKPMGYAGGRWWITGLGISKPLPKNIRPFGQ